MWTALNNLPSAQAGARLFEALNPGVRTSSKGGNLASSRVRVGHGLAKAIVNTVVEENAACREFA